MAVAGADPSAGASASLGAPREESRGRSPGSGRSPTFRSTAGRPVSDGAKTRPTGPSAWPGALSHRATGVDAGEGGATKGSVPMSRATRGFAPASRRGALPRLAAGSPGASPRDRRGGNRRTTASGSQPCKERGAAGTTDADVTFPVAGGTPGAPHCGADPPSATCSASPESVDEDEGPLAGGTAPMGRALPASGALNPD
jgi:hypothetical protein